MTYSILCLDVSSTTLSAWATVALVLITAYYAFDTHRMVKATREAPEKAYELGLKSQKEQHKRLVSELTQNLTLKVVSQEGQGVVVRICNPTDHPIHGAVATITMAYQSDDVMVPVDFSTWIDQGSCVPLVEDRLCWSTRVDGSNPQSCNILAGEEASLSLFRFCTKLTRSAASESEFRQKPASVQQGYFRVSELLVVASEEGFGRIDWPQSTKRARVALLRKPYRLWLKVVSEDTTSKVWELSFIDKPLAPFEIRRVVTHKELETIQTDVRNWKQPVSHALRTEVA